MRRRTAAQERLLAKARRGEEITPEDKIAAFETVGDCDALQRQLGETGQLTAERLRLLQERREALAPPEKTNSYPKLRKRHG